MPETRLAEIGEGQRQSTNRAQAVMCGWEVTWWAGSPGYWLISAGQDERRMDEGGAGLSTATEPSPKAPGTPVIDKVVATVMSNGGKVIVPKMTVPGRGWLAYCQDSDGTVFGIVQGDGAAR